jgi:hypothetical protein
MIDRSKYRKPFTLNSSVINNAAPTKLVQNIAIENHVDFRCEFDLPKFCDLNIAVNRDSK